MPGKLAALTSGVSPSPRETIGVASVTGKYSRYLSMSGWVPCIGWIWLRINTSSTIFLTGIEDPNETGDILQEIALLQLVDGFGHIVVENIVGENDDGGALVVNAALDDAADADLVCTKYGADFSYDARRVGDHKAKIERRARLADGA